MRAAIATAFLFVLLAAPARAGGDFVDLAVARGAVWVVGSFGVRALDAASGRVRYAPQPTAPRIPLSVAVAGGAVWVASVENGFVAGRVTRIGLRTHRARVVWQSAAGSAQYVAAGAGGVYALLGLRGGSRVIRIALDGRVTGSWAVGDGGRMAADASGCWVSANGRLVHIDPRGRVHTLTGIGFGDVATGGGSVWVALPHAIVSVDERTAATRTLRTGPLHPGGFQHDLALGDGALWTLDTQPARLQRRDPETGRVLRSVALPGISDAVVPTPAGVWVATAVGHLVLRFDPSTLRRTLRVAVD